MFRKDIMQKPESTETIVARIDEKVQSLFDRLFGTTPHDPGAIKLMTDQINEIKDLNPRVTKLEARQGMMFKLIFGGGGLGGLVVIVLSIIGVV